MTANTWTPLCLQKIEALIRAATTEEQRRILHIKKACLLARFTLVEDAANALNSVRPSAGAFDPRLNAWATFCEGLIEYCGSLAEKSIRGFRRAQVVSIAAGDVELAALSSAWIAAAEFNIGNFAAVPGAIAQTFTYADRSNAAAIARACLVVANMYNWEGQTSIARSWYKRARDAAVEEGDISMQSVVMYNDASYRVWNVVLDDCKGSAASHDIMLADVAVDSVGNLDHGLGIRRLTSLVPLMRAELCVVQKRWDDAIGLFDAYLSDTSVEAQNRVFPKFQAQRAYCLAMSGDSNGAITQLSAALSEADTCTDFDDLFVLHTRAAGVFAATARLEDAERHRLSAERCLSAFANFRTDLRQMIDPMVERIRRLEEQKKSPA